MRTPNLGSVFYAPQDPPDDPAELPRYLREETQRIQAAIAALALGHIDKSNVAPTKPRTGDLRLADGTNWDPGSGQGVYVYYGSAWHFLG